MTIDRPGVQPHPGSRAARVAAALTERVRTFWAPQPLPRGLEHTATVISAWAIALGVVLSVVSSVADWQAGRLTPRDQRMIAVHVPLLVVTGGWFCAAVLRRRPSLRAQQVHTLYCAALAVMAMLRWQNTPDMVFSPGSHAVLTAMVVSWACFSWRGAAAITTLICICATGSQEHGLPTSWDVWANAAYNPVMCMVIIAGWTSVITMVRIAGYADCAQQKSAARLATVQEELAESNRWDAIIHDYVLGALGSAAREGVPDADRITRILARKAVKAWPSAGSEVVEGPREESGSLAGILAGAAKNLGLAARIQIHGEPGPRQAEAFATAGVQALTNVAEHAGVQQVTITGRFDPDLGELRIRDTGAGFDPAAVPRSRRGLRTSIRSTMELAGGWAEIRSRPGRGTAVELSWRPQVHNPVRLNSLPAFRAAMVMLSIGLLISVALGLRALGPVISLPVQAGGAVGTLVMVAAALWWPPPGLARSRQLRPRPSRAAALTIVILTVALQTMMLANLRPTAELGWQEWFIGFGLAVFTPLAWRTRSRWIPVLVVASWPVMTIGAALLSGQNPVVLATSRAPSFAFPLMFSGAAAWASANMNRALRSIHASHSELLRSTRDRTRARAVHREAARRLEAVNGAPLEMLEKLAEGAPITAEMRRECAVLEASARDLLVAPGVLSTRMSDSFGAARRRGARILITGSVAPAEVAGTPSELDPSWDDERPAEGGPGSQPPDPHSHHRGLEERRLEAFRRSCLELAALAGPRWQLTCRWNGGAGGAPAPVVLARLRTSPLASAGSAAADPVTLPSDWPQLEAIAADTGVDLEIIGSAEEVAVVIGGDAGATGPAGAAQPASADSRT